jgi:hypothetical protein
MQLQLTDADTAIDTGIKEAARIRRKLKLKLK